MKQNKTFVLVAMGLTALAVGIYQSQNQPTVMLNESNGLAQIGEAETRLDLAEKIRPPVSAAIDKKNEPDEKAIQTAFLEKFSSRISQPKGKIQFIDQLIRYLQKNYGAEWQTYFAQWVETIFPEQAELILAMHNTMQTYQQWLIDEKHSLAAMTPDERRRVTWETRRSLFGEDMANAIWQGSLQREQISASLSRLNEQTDLTFAEQAASYRQAIEAALGDQSDSFIQKHQQETIDRFLNTRAVQENLQTMPTTQRKAALAKLRSDMGMDEAAIERWEALDEQREARWAKGMEYMKQRAELDTEALTKLQNELFGDEAEIIRNEESGGYFRFSRPQIIGLN